MARRPQRTRAGARHGFLQGRGHAHTPRRPRRARLSIPSAASARPDRRSSSHAAKRTRSARTARRRRTVRSRTCTCAATRSRGVANTGRVRAASRGGRGAGARRLHRVHGACRRDGAGRETRRSAWRCRSSRGKYTLYAVVDSAAAAHRSPGGAGDSLGLAARLTGSRPCRTRLPSGSFERRPPSPGTP